LRPFGICGVRPNSPIQTISVESSRPRCFRSSMSWAQAGSSTPLRRLTALKLSLCVSQLPLPGWPPSVTSTKGTPCSQAPGKQTALAEEIAAIGIANCDRLVFDIKHFLGGRAHQLDGALIGSLMALRSDAGPLVDEVLLQILQQLDAGVELLLADAG